MQQRLVEKLALFLAPQTASGGRTRGQLNMKLRHRHEVSRQSFTKSAQNRLSLRGRGSRRCGSVFVRKPALQLDRGRYCFPRCASLRAEPSPLVRQTAWHTRGENMEGATPPFSGAGAPRGGESNFIPNFTPRPMGVAPSLVIPAGRLKGPFSRCRPAGRVLRPSRGIHTLRAAPEGRRCR